MDNNNLNIDNDTMNQIKNLVNGIQEQGVYARISSGRCDQVWGVKGVYWPLSGKMDGFETYKGLC